MEDPELRDYISTLRRQRWVVLAPTVVLALGALAVSLLQTKQYRAEAELLLRLTASEQLLVDENGQVRSAQDAERQINNEVRLIESLPMRDAVAAAYDGPLDVDDVSAAPQSEDADIIVLGATGDDPAAVAELVNVYAETYVDQQRQHKVDDLLATASDIQEQIDRVNRDAEEVQAPLVELEGQIASARDQGSTVTEDGTSVTELEEQRTALADERSALLQSLDSERMLYTGQLEQVQASAELTRSGGVQLVTPAERPSHPASPNPERNVTVALLAGLVLGVGLAFAVDRLDDSIRSKEEAERITGLPALGLIPRAATRKEGRPTDLVTLRDPGSPSAEAYRSLRTSVKFLGVDAPIRTVLVTSAAPSEGKTVTAANLAVVLAQAGERVLLLDADLRRPRVHQLFGAPASPGLTTLLLDDVPLSSAVVPVEKLPNLHLVPPGVTPRNPAELLDGERARALFGSLSETYDTVVIDSPPVLPVTDAQVLSRLAAAVLVVVAHRETSRRGLGRAIELLGQVDAPVVGTVVNLVPNGQIYSGYSYHRYEPDTGRSGRQRQRSRHVVREAELATHLVGGGDGDGRGDGDGDVVAAGGAHFPSPDLRAGTSARRSDEVAPLDDAL